MINIRINAVVLPDLNPYKILIAGDAMLDRYWFGAVSRISPEAPVPVVAVANQQQRCGGAANVACNVAALGARARLLCVTGDDTAADDIQSLLDEQGVAHGCVRDVDHATTVKLRIIAQNQQLLRADFDTEPGFKTAQLFNEQFDRQISDAHAVIISDYGKGSLADVPALIAKTKAQSIPALVDPKGRDFTRYRGAYMITPNLSEFEAVAGVSANDEDLSSRAFDMVHGYELNSLLITRGERGMSLFTHAGKQYHAAARAREVFDVSGAGDTVIASMAVAVCAKLCEDDSLKLANTAAGLVVRRLGTAIVARAELDEELVRGQ